MRVKSRRVLVAACAAGIAAVLPTTATVAAPAVTSATGPVDPFSTVYGVEFSRGKITKSSVRPLDKDAFSRVDPTPKDVDEEIPRDPGPIQPALAELLRSNDQDRRVEIVITYPDPVAVPVFPMPAFKQSRNSRYNKKQRAAAAKLIRQLKADRTAHYRRQAAVLHQFDAEVLETYWLIQGARVRLPLSAVPKLLETGVQYLELADGVARPPADANPDNDTIDARAQIRSDAYYNLHQTGGWIGLLDTGVRTSHVSFNAPDHVSVTQDLTGDGDPTDQCNHGTASAALITGNSRLGADWRGVTGITLDSFDIYGDDCLVGGGHTVAGFQQAVAWLDKVIVAEVQLDASETSSASTAADAAFDTGSVVVAANGNFGPDAGTVRSPGNAHKALGIGAADLVSDNLMGYSGRGPTADGRYKPDLVFPTNVETARSGSDTAMGSFGGTSCATPIAGGAVALLRNWMRGGVGSIDAGHVYSQAILGGQTTWPFDNNTGAGPFVLGTGGTAWWGKVNVGHGTQVDIPINVTAGKNLFEGALWWPESAALHNDIDLALVAPDGTVRDISISGVSVFERAGVSGLSVGGWKLRITGFSVTGTQSVYWSARTR
ncbi:MAG TPA: S8 family serine peptidase [Actinoplanes sp.]|nr:S8 family serine peptidase [Actinoplanes sp.]